MEDKGLQKVYYVLTSQKSWQPGRSVLGRYPIPAWCDPGAARANVAIMKMMRT
jgi:hypothetical protein